jgi:hypothetical protein
MTNLRKNDKKYWKLYLNMLEQYQKDLDYESEYLHRRYLSDLTKNRDESKKTKNQIKKTKDILKI